MGKHASNFLESATEFPEKSRIGRHRGDLPSGRRRLDTVALPVLENTALLTPDDPASVDFAVLRPVRRPVVRRRVAGVAATTASLMMVGGMAGVGTYMSASEVTDTGLNAVIAPSDAVLVPDRVDVTTVPAPPVVDSPEPAVQDPGPAAVEPAPPVVVAETPVPAPVAAPAPAPVAPPVPAAPPKAPAGLKAPLISASARSQLGWTQDCTMLVTNALANVGINFHDWPAGYFSLGSVVSASEALPGDLIYYANGGMNLAHIAVYDGDGMAIHGGWNGNQTVRASAYVGSGPVFIRVA